MAGKDREEPGELGYGAHRVRLPLEGCNVLLPGAAEPGQNGGKMAEDAVARPRGSPSLAELAKGARSAVILVSGRDRVTRADVFMPPILSALREAGLKNHQISVIAATGTHLPFEKADLPLLVGPEFPNDISVTGHACQDESALTEIGITSRGNRVRVNSRALNADLKILTGRITHHYFAGFTAGRKAVLPGVSAYETILFNHRLVVSGTDDHIVPPTVANGRLSGNPVHEDMMEAAAFFHADFVMNTALDTRHEVMDVFAGDSVEAHHAGCALVDREFAFRGVKAADLVVASCGGAPYDCSFIQTIKTIFNCHHAARDGGVMLVLAECPEGIKKGFHEWAKIASLEQLATEVRRNYNLAGHNSILLRQVLQRIRVILVSSLPKEEVEHLGLIAAATAEDGWRMARNLCDTDMPTTLVIPSGNVTVVDHGTLDPVLAPAAGELDTANRRS